MKEYLKILFSDNGAASIGRVGFILIILTVVMLCISYIIISIKGIIWGLPTIDILDRYDYLILGMVGSGIIQKTVSKYIENKEIK
ncbi:MAG: hypothetical protein PHN88_02865 [Ignavibacteria bacterium]|nr:hypothetical protein [Ignavibacteria bacterium]